ncbi:sugar transporter [Frateuria sp. Soil773]|uniref:LPS translocon maturation chaperone LptM n=1 Tax=Frateuria sp. Soil773 TaxID=1736407 RepID=UPI0006F6E7C3|nr:lipoprotein [Frateuria sp. Soil773]KRF01188.1 sugar transporter [Frateuria sp. Soil773]
MRRLIPLLVLCLAFAMLAACGNKGPLVLPPAKPATPATAPAPASTAPAPVAVQP